ncbi:hypothetical protein BDY19DRAFT_973028 [Irpex rosettiformis]|uniref:Uncharacterized protein n=1 Tax=Irpex rosettiformis TaxID=378272 RepID=A0ACB8TR12_9APHY|nr:hypothetical protein BDY19DRAFT_973028 [Irpex rosettiformis]
MYPLPHLIVFPVRFRLYPWLRVSKVQNGPPTFIACTAYNTHLETRARQDLRKTRSSLEEAGVNGYTDRWEERIISVWRLFQLVGLCECHIFIFVWQAAPTMGWSVKFARDPVHRRPQVRRMRASMHMPLHVSGYGSGHSQVRMAYPLTRKESGRLSQHVVYVAARFELVSWPDIRAHQLRTLWDL